MPLKPLNFLQMQETAARKLLCVLSHQTFFHYSFFQGALSVDVSDSIVALSHNTKKTFSIFYFT